MLDKLEHIGQGTPQVGVGLAHHSMLLPLDARGEGAAFAGDVMAVCGIPLLEMGYPFVALGVVANCAYTSGQAPKLLGGGAMRETRYPALTFALNVSHTALSHHIGARLFDRLDDGGAAVGCDALNIYAGVLDCVEIFDYFARSLVVGNSVKESCFYGLVSVHYKTHLIGEPGTVNRKVNSFLTIKNLPHRIRPQIGVEPSR